MIKIKSIAVKNFLSVGNATQALRLDDHALTLILGNNSDANGGVTRNGAGKTALLQALSFSIYGQPLTKIKVGNLINNINQKGMYVVVEFEDGEDDYRIERGKKPDILKFYKNGEEIKSDDAGDVKAVDNDAKGENKETQRDIDRVIGMSHTMFKHVVALNTYTEPFLKEGSGKQREIIEELLGVTQISNRAEILKQLISATKDTVKTEEAHIAAIRNTNVRIQQAVDSAEREVQKWATKHQHTIENLEEEITAMATIDFDVELQNFEDLDQWRKSERVLRSDFQIASKEVEQMERDRKRLDSDLKRARVDADGTTARSAIDRLERDLARMRANVTGVEASITQKESDLKRLEDALAHPGEQECKTCGQALSGTDHLAYVVRRLTEDRDGVKVALASKIVELAEINSDITSLEHDIDVRTNELSKAKEIALTAIDRLNGEVTALDEQIVLKNHMVDQIQIDIKALGTKPETLFESRDEVYTAKHAREILLADLERNKASVNPFTGQVDGLRAGLQVVDMESLNEAHDLLRHQDFLFKLLTSKDSFIRRKIIEQNLTFLNNRLNAYLVKLGLPHDVIFQSDLSVEIRLLGRDMDFAQLSRGEGNRVIMATSWAFRDVWESLNHRFNLMFLDEILDNGTDGAGAEAGLQILKEFGRNGRNIFLVSHRDELVGRIDNLVMVSKENGFTTFTPQ